MRVESELDPMIFVRLFHLRLALDILHTEQDPTTVNGDADGEQRSSDASLQEMFDWRRIIATATTKMAANKR